MTHADARARFVSRMGAALAACGLTVVGATMTLVTSISAQADGHRLSVTVNGLCSGQGQVIVCLWSEPSTFPDCGAAQPYRRAVTPVAGPATAGQSNAGQSNAGQSTTGQVRVTFDAVPTGGYAVSVLHDENEDGKTAVNLLGIPSEGVGVSRNIRKMMGAPSFADARFRLESNLTQPITIQY
jgi:uncharacterized protein (DUF2141 family)